MSITLFKNEKYNCEIIKRQNSRIFRLKGKYNSYISFNVNYLSSDDYDWFCDTVGKQIQETIDNVESRTLNKQQKALRNLFGIN